MNPSTLKISMAAYCHDLGKFADKESLEITEQYVLDNSGPYLPQRDGRHTHHHALYTAAFIEYLKDLLPAEFNQPEWGDGDPFINLAAGHHHPQTPMQWIIAVADRIGSGWDRNAFEHESGQSIPWRDYKKTRLAPVLEQLLTANIQEAADCRFAYPLKPLGPETMFPGLRENVVPTDPETAKAEYRDLFDGFLEGLRTLKHRQSSLALWFDHFDSLMMRFASCVPSARAGRVLPDVSLYDHAKTTAALAAALYLYHLQTDTLTIDAVQTEENKKFLLINGNFLGIQTFIFGGFGEARKYRSKILRGRSFAVSLMSDLAADALCREIGLCPTASVLLQAAGQFTVMAPNTSETESAAAAAARRINDWLATISYGQTAITLNTVAASCDDFVSGRFRDLWDEKGRRNDEAKFSRIDLDRHGGTVTDYLSSFQAEDRPVCALCGKRPAHPDTRGDGCVKEVPGACRLCRDHVFLGTNLVKKHRLVVCDPEAGGRIGPERLMEPLFGVYQAGFCETDLDDLAADGRLYRCWRLGGGKEDLTTPDVAVRFTNGYVPVYSDADLSDLRLFQGREPADPETLGQKIKSQDPKTLNDIAKKARKSIETPDKFTGVEALGVLKADVDRLGVLMSCGLPRKRFTISRLATLSRQLNAYFSLYLPHFLKTDPMYSDVYTVFAGGDDLFLIGPWNRMTDLALTLRNSFSDYVCHNPEIHFSAGVTVHKPHTPVEHIAETAEHALNAAKAAGRNRFTQFSETVEWNDMAELTAIGEAITDWLADGSVNRGMLHRLNELLEMARREKALVSDGVVHLADMDCAKWRAMLTYTVGRNAGRGLKKEARERLAEEITLKLADWLDRRRGAMKLPLWRILYNSR